MFDLSDPSLLKTVHILSAILLFGTGLGTAFHGLVNVLSKDAKVAASALRAVVLADWLFTTPTVIVQPLSGAWLAHAQGWAWDTPWLLASVGLYVLAGACWLPVVWLQLRMARLAAQAAAEGAALPLAFWRLLRIWTLLGIPAFTAMVGVVWLMVAKPW